MIAHTVSNESDVIGEASNPVRTQNTLPRDPQVLALMEAEMRRNSLITNGGIYDLDNEEMRDKLQTDGILLKLSREANFMVKENASTGFGWLVDEAVCDDETITIDTRYGQTVRADPNAGLSADGAVDVR